jgi:hypothetical protein
MILVLEVFYRKRLYAASSPVIIWFQDNKTDFWVTFFQVVSILGNGPLYFYVTMHIFLFGSRARSIYYVVFICIGLFFGITMKIGYHDPRPYMTDPKIVVFHCQHDFGNPSAHQMFMTGYFTFYFLDFYHGKPEHGG